MNNQSNSIRPRNSTARETSPGHGHRQNNHDDNLAPTLSYAPNIEILEITHQAGAHRRRFKRITTKSKLEAERSVGLRDILVAMTLVAIGGLVLFTLVTTVLVTFVCLWVQWLINLLADSE